MMSPSSQHSNNSPKGHKRTPSFEFGKHKRTPSREYNDINLRNMTEDDFEQVVQNNGLEETSGIFSRLPGLDSVRTCFSMLEGSRGLGIVAAAMLIGLVIALPIIATMPMGGNTNGNNALSDQIESNALGASDDVSNYICKHDRRANDMPLYPHRFICSTNGRFIFGMTDDGKLVYRDIESDIVETYYEGSKGDYFVLETDGSFVVKNKHDEVQWTRENFFMMHYNDNCLEKYPCPYLHIHNGGVLVINYIDEGGEWQTKNFKHTVDVGYP